MEFYYESKNPLCTNILVFSGKPWLYNSIWRIDSKQQAAKYSNNQDAKIAHDAYIISDFLKAGQYYEKAYNLSKVKVYRDNALVAYTSYAFNLAK